MIDILKEITRLRLEKNSGLTQSTISTWYRKNQIPTIQTLDKICKGFGITLSQFFAEGDDAISLTSEQKEILNNWSCLNEHQKQVISDLLKVMK